MDAQLTGPGDAGRYMDEDGTLLDHLTPQFATPCHDQSTFDLYERNFGVTLPKMFCTVMSANSSAVLCAVYLHPDLPVADNEFFVWRLATIGRHKYNEPRDLLVRTEFEHHNTRSIPKKVIVFGFDYREWPIYLDLTDGADGRIVVHSDDNRLPRPDWTDFDAPNPCAYVASGFSQFISNLTSDPNPPL